MAPTTPCEHIKPLTSEHYISMLKQFKHKFKTLNPTNVKKNQLEESEG